MVASALVATMPGVGCRSEGRNRHKDEERAPHANKSDRDQCVDGCPVLTVSWVAFSPPTAMKGSVCSPTSAPLSAGRWSHGREPGFIGVSIGFPAVTWCPGGVVGRARHRDTQPVALRDKLK